MHSKLYDIALHFRFIQVTFILLVVAYFPLPSAQSMEGPLYINEICASNSTILKDPQGQFDDWIEIYNTSDASLNVAGLYLTDDPSDPNKWRFPLGQPETTTISAKDYLIIWADLNTTDSGLHTNFKLDADGEYIGLFDIDGVTLIDSLTFGLQATDISFGRFPDGSDTWQLLNPPTPGVQNEGILLGWVDDVTFSHERGFYDAPFTLELYCPTPEVEIYFTSDGSVPIAENNPTAFSTLYTGPIAINTTTCLRAAAIKTGWLPSRTLTQTYILHADDLLQTLPVISLVGDEYTTLYEPDGIMAIVGGTYNQEVWRPSGPGSYNNAIQRGIAFERPISFEILDKGQNTHFQMDCGIRVHGSDYTRPRYTRGDDWLSCWVNFWPNWNSNKFSFNLFFRNQYGHNRFEFPFFPIDDGLQIQSMALRGGHNDACSPFVKDEWARRLFREMGQVQVTGTFANLLINGKYKGYYNPCPRMDEEFLQAWYDTDNAFDVITQSGVRDGDNMAWNELLTFITQNDLSDPVHYAEVADRLDISTFIDFLILEIYIANFDWPGNNWDVHRERSGNGVFRFSVWDAEGLAETWAVGDNYDWTAFENFPTWANPRGLNNYGDPVSRLYRALKANPDFRQLFADHVQRHLKNNGILTTTHLLSRWEQVFAEITMVLPETEQYPVRFVPDEFLPNRESHVLSAFAENDLFNLAIGAPMFYVNDIAQHGGSVHTDDSLSITTESGTIYYTLDGTDPRVPGTVIGPAMEQQNIVSEDASKRVLVPTAPLDSAWKSDLDFDDSLWITGAGGVGYESGFGYHAYFDIDLLDEMYNSQTSCYIRILFEIDTDDLQDLDALTLNLRYDDGFIAYINGVEVTRRNFTGTPTWSSVATSQHDDSAAVIPERIDILDHIDAFNQGQNLLAIHGLNRSSSSSDLLFSAAIMGAHVVSSAPDIADTATEYTSPLTLSQNTHIKARTLSQGVWSALSEAVFLVD